MNITEFRKQYPQYNDMDDASLANNLYEKHYKDMPREDFNSKFLGQSQKKEKSFLQKVGDYIGNAAGVLTEEANVPAESYKQLTDLTKSGVNYLPPVVIGKTALSGLAGAASGLGAFAAHGNVDEGLEAGTNTVGKVNEALTYHPKTATGRGVEKAVMYPFEKWSQLSEYLADNPHHGPMRQALDRTILELVPFGLGAGRGRFKGKAAPKPTIDPAVLAKREEVVNNNNIFPQHERVMGELQRAQDVQNARLSQTKQPQEIQQSLLTVEPNAKPEIDPNTVLTQGDVANAYATTVDRTQRILPKTQKEIVEAQAAKLNDLYGAAVEAKSSGKPYHEFASDLAASGVDINGLLSDLNSIGLKGLKDFYEQFVPLKNRKGNVQALRDKLLRDLNNQKPGLFNHDTSAGIPARDNLSVDPAVKPVIKATPQEFAAMRANKEVGPGTHYSYFPEGPKGDVVYLINKEGLERTGKTLDQVKKDLVSGKEAEHLGYPERSKNPAENKTAAVTKDKRIVTNPEEIKAEQQQGNLEWAAEGRPEEVLAKAEEVAFTNSIHHNPIVVGKPGRGAHIAEEGYSYRSLSQEEINSIQETGEVLPNPKGKSKGGRSNTKHWSEANGKLYYRPDQTVIRVRTDSIERNKPVSAKDVEIWNKDTGEFEPLEKTTSNNGSGESSASLEAQSRLSSENKEGAKFYKVENGVVKNEIPATVDRVDTFSTRPNEAIIKVVGDSMERVHGEGPLPRKVPVSKEVLPEKIGEYDLSSEFEQDRGTLSSEEGVGIGEELKTPQSLDMDVEPPIPDSTSLGLEEIEVETNQRPTTLTKDGITNMNMGPNPREALDAVIDGLKEVGLDNSSYALRNFCRGWREPQFLAEGIPWLRKLYRLSGLKREVRSGIRYDLYRSGLEEGYEVYHKLSKLEQRDLSRIVDLSDVYKIKFTADTLRGDTHFLGRPLSEGVIKAYELIRKQTVENIKRKAIEDRETASLQFEDRPWYQDLRDLLIDRDEEGVPSIDLEENPYYLEDKGLSFNKQFMRDFAKLKERIAKIDAVEEQRLEMPFYVTRATRKPGDWGVYAYEVVDGVVREDLPIFFDTASTPRKARKLQAEVEKNPQKYFPNNYHRMSRNGETPQFALKIKETTTLPEEIYLHAGTPEAGLGRLKSALERAKEHGRISEKEYDEVYQELVDSYEDTILMRGAGRYNIKRNQRLIEGYRTDNYFDILKEQIDGMAGAIAKSRYSMSALKLVTESPKEFKTLLQDLVTSALRNKNTRIDAGNATFRALVTLFHLGYRPVSFIVNMFQNYGLGAAELNFRLRKHFKDHKSATPDIMKAQEQLVVRAKLPVEDQAFLDWFDRTGASQAQFIDEISAKGEQVVSQKIQTATQHAMWVFGKTESVFNRQAIGLAAWRRFKKLGLEENVARELAREVSDTAHGDMSAENLPPNLQGAKVEPWARSALGLRRYNIHMVNYIFNRMAQKEYRPVMRLLFVQTALGGLKAAPFVWAANSLFERLYGKSLFMAVRKAIYKTMGSQQKDLAEVVDNVIQHGLPILIGLDFSGNLTLDIPFMFEEGEKTAWERVGGVFASDIKNVGRGIEKMRSGQPVKGLVQMMPSIIKDPANAIIGYNEGIEDSSGNPMVDKQGKPIIFTPYEAAIRALGITPARLGLTRDIRSSEYNIETYYRDEIRRFNKRIKNADTAKEKSAIQRERLQFQRDFDKEYPGLAGRIGRAYREPRRNRTLENRLNFERGNF